MVSQAPAADTLALAVLWNVWALRRHVRRRLATEEALRAEHAFRKAMEDSLHTGMRAVEQLQQARAVGGEAHRSTSSRKGSSSAT